MGTKFFFTGLALVAAGLVGAGGAQTAAAQDISVHGRVITAPYFDAGRRLVLSQNDYTYGTSRATAMGGAFTSLGADLTSMSINPAGLGMYQSSDWGFTQALSINTMKTGSDLMKAGSLSSGGSKVSYGLNNVGIAWNVFNRSGGLTSLTLGFGYNRAANFNSHSTVRTTEENSSIAEMFREQLHLMATADKYPVSPEDLEPGERPFENGGIYLDEWAAVLGYQTGLVGLNGEGAYGALNGVVPADSYFRSVTRGGVYEYDFSAGFNISNILYLGASLSATDIKYHEDTSYEENYPLSSEAKGMWFDQSTRISGSGFTAKFGAIARPVEALRIGVAFHLPTYYTIEKSYTGAMGLDNYSADTGDPLVDEQHFRTAPRLLAGISGTIADRAIIALDYDVAWYNKIRMTMDTYAGEIEESKAESASLYKPAHTLRAGLEVRANDIVSLRAGGSYMFDFLKQKDAVFDNPAVRSGYTATVGAGFNLGRGGYIDVAYVYNRVRYTNYDFYYWRYGNEPPFSQYDTVGGIEYSREYTPRKNHHTITLTLGSRF